MITITREFTKEQLIEHLRSRIEHRKGIIASIHIDRGYRDYLKLELRSSEIALASLEAEAVAWRCVSTVTVNKPVADDWKRRGFAFHPLYAAPPAPSIDEDLLHMAASAIDDLLSNKDRFGAGVWADIPAKLRRAAMLQGADGNSPVIPDGSEDTKRLDWLDAQNKRLNEYYGTSYGWKFDANFQRNAMMLNDSNYPVMTVRQAIDEAIAAAPQQEVKP